MKAQDLNLAEIMQFDHGRVELHGRRLILHDLHSLGQFRHDLIDALGEEEAHRILTRKGYFWGNADAAAMKKMFQWDNTEEWLKAGPMLSRIEGLAEMEIHIRTLDFELQRFEIELVWHNSSEVEQHLSMRSQSAYPICWVLIGYASGYVSYCVGKPVYFIEIQCQAAGSPCCVALGKDVNLWGKEIEPYLAFFHAADIQKKVQDLSAQIERQQQELNRQKRRLKENGRIPELSPVEARSPVFRQTVELAARVAKYDTTVLITGETGTGKEVLARYIHQNSPRALKPFLAVNCSAMPDNLLESELFGHRAGSFTGASRNHQGLFEEANGGTVFLDEIGDISPVMQVKLLRVLQEREIKPIGEVHSRPVDVRVISATNKDLEKLVAQGEFREDLFFRLHVVHIKIPPLRERRDDILPLARHFILKCAERLKIPELRLSPSCVDLLANHSWPGNVRELENILEHAAIMCRNQTITPDILPLNPNRLSSESRNTSLYRTLEEVELDHIQQVMKLTGGNRTESAKILQIGEATLYRKLRLLGNFPK